MTCARCLTPDESGLDFAGGAREMLRARLSLLSARAWGPDSKAPTAELVSEGLWITQGPDQQSCGRVKAPCGGRPRSVWNPPHGPCRPRRVLSSDLFQQIVQLHYCYTSLQQVGWYLKRR